MRADPDLDVVVVGYGPTGALLALWLGQLGYRVAVVERFLDIYNLPRAVHFDDEIGRILQAVGVRDEVVAITDPVRDLYEWRNRDGRPLLQMDWSRAGLQGWPAANFFTQPELQRVLDRRVAAVPEVERFTGWEVTAIADHGDHVRLTATRRPAFSAAQAFGTRELRARYVVGADGANSFVRQSLGIEFHDLGFVPFDWLIVDVVPHDAGRTWSPTNWQLCDPARPTTVVSGGPRRRRWEFMRLPGETIEELNTEEAAWRLLEPWGMTPGTARLERHAVYRFMARYAETWRDGRILLAGDAAHLMPPFAGQGMCNGLRDAANLGWKLDLVLSGRSPEGLLDSYQRERLDHVRQWIEFSAALGEVICVLDEDAARARDERMIAGDADPMRVLPAAPPQRLGAGLYCDEQPAAGALFIQAPVGLGDINGLFDELVGRGFVLLGTQDAALSGLGDRHRSILETLGARIAWLDGDTGSSGAVRDLTGAYAAWFEAHDAVVVLARPDFYVFGVARQADQVPALVEALGDALQLTTTNRGLTS
jgi:2-polyprenyl-6-methoxyphenol hydroxylase-like FAD-dependent oxidoreductase